MECLSVRNAMQMAYIKRPSHLGHSYKDIHLHQIRCDEEIMIVNSMR
jgi:hypothetical protein